MSTGYYYLSLLKPRILEKAFSIFRASMVKKSDHSVRLQWQVFLWTYTLYVGIILTYLLTLVCYFAIGFSLLKIWTSTAELDQLSVLKLPLTVYSVVVIKSRFLFLLLHFWWSIWSRPCQFFGVKMVQVKNTEYWHKRSPISSFWPKQLM